MYYKRKSYKQAVNNACIEGFKQIGDSLKKYQTISVGNNYWLKR